MSSRLKQECRNHIHPNILSRSSNASPTLGWFLKIFNTNSWNETLRKAFSHSYTWWKTRSMISKWHHSNMFSVWWCSLMFRPIKCHITIWFLISRLIWPVKSYTTHAVDYSLPLWNVHINIMSSKVTWHVYVCDSTATDEAHTEHSRVEHTWKRNVQGGSSEKTQMTHTQT